MTRCSKMTADMKFIKALLFSTNLSLMLLVSCGKKIEDTKKPVGSVKPPIEDVLIEDVDQEQRQNVLTAIKAHSLSMLQPLLDESPHIDYLFKNGETPLTMAIKTNATDLYSVIIRKVKNFNLMNKSKESALHLAVSTNHLFLVNLLLSKNIDVNLRDKDGLTPLVLSLKKPSEFIAIKLITNGASIQEYNELGLSVKQIARSQRLRELLELLKFVDEHKDVSVYHLSSAIRMGNINIVDYLLNTFPEYKEIITKRNVLLTAIKIKDHRTRKYMLQKLLSRGANPNNAEGGVTPLILAVISKQYQSVEKLLAYGADTNIVDDTGLSAVDHARQNFYFDILRLLNQSTRN